MATTKTLIVIAGPTAAGKTNIAIDLAQKLKCDILSADSRQFFKEISIGTAKPNKQDLEAVKHHFIDVISVEERISAGEYEKLALQKLEAIFQKNDFAILVGGSGLYIDALCNGIDEFPEISDKTKKEALNIFQNEGLSGLKKVIEEKDNTYYHQVDLGNKARLMRACEVIIETGKPYSTFKRNEPKQRPFTIKKFVLQLPREVLYKKINLRVDKMLDDGLLEEARAQIKNKHLQALQTVGYKELFQYFEGNLTKPEAIEKIKQHTRNYAKRQITWFKKDPKNELIDCSNQAKATSEIFERVLN